MKVLRTHIDFQSLISQWVISPLTTLYGGVLGRRLVGSFRWGLRHLRIHPGALLRIEKGANIELADNFTMGFNGNPKVPLPSNGKSGLVLKNESRFKAGMNATLHRGAHIHVSSGSEVSVGEETHIGFNSQIIARDKILIGSHCAISWNVTILDSDLHSIAHRPLSQPVIIKDKVYIGHSASILPGVSIGEGAIIGSNSVVTKDIPANCLAVGNPAKVIRRDIAWEH